MPESDSPYEMTFMPNTIEHLGARMYSTMPPVLAELIANAYDADASEVHIHLIDNGEKQIVVADNGHGMSGQDINDKFLRIGRNRRDDDNSQTSPQGRPVIGKKGLGKLSFFGVAHQIQVQTQKDHVRNTLVLDWEKIVDYSDGAQTRNYRPDAIETNVEKPKDPDGTVITLKDIQRISDFEPETLADSLAKIFILDPGFKIFIKHNSSSEIEVENTRKYSDLKKDFEWEVPQDTNVDSDYTRINEVKGHLIATETPISPKTNMRGITLFSRKKLVNLPEYFSDSTSSHFFSYLTGWLQVDFIDDLDEDVIETNRQSINWDHPEMVKLREYLQKLIRWLERDWRKKRSEKRQEDLSETTGINIQDWLSTMPDDISSKVGPIVEALVTDSELPVTVNKQIVQDFHALVPEYPKYHWRHLHPEIQSIAREDYINARYFDATEKASRLYIQRVKEKSGVDTGNDSNDIDSAFNPGNGKLMVTECSTTTERNIQSGQHYLSKGIVAGARNPLTHNPEYEERLVNTGLMTEKDCLDMLSIISHLFGRLENAQLRSETEPDSEE